MEHAGDQLLFLRNGKIGADMQSNITLFSFFCVCVCAVFLVPVIAAEL